MLEEDFQLSNKQVQDASKVKISDLTLQEKTKIEYLFDFGDEWLHEITLEKILDIFPKKRYPLVTKKAGQSPPQYPDYDDEEDYE